MNDMTPIGLIVEEDFIKRNPERRKEFLRHAIEERETRRVILEETKQAFTWHPVHTTKTILFTGILSFIIAFLVSQVVSVGHWYANAKSWSIPIALPLVEQKSIDIGSYVPSSTELAAAAKVPSFGIRESIGIAVFGMVLVLIERLVTSFFQLKKSRRISAALHELDAELRMLREWQRTD